VLIASVGGSPAPIVRAIADTRPRFALFLATETEGSRPGSADEIPGILQRAQATTLAHQILIVPPDDPEAIFLRLRETLRTLAASHAGARLVFDYTGGTKSMTSALFQAALATPGAALQFMAGRRETLDRVTDGTERATPIPVDWLLAERTEARLRAAWGRFAYAECAEGIALLLDDLGTDEKAPPETRQRLRDLGEAAAAFDAWDRFDHKGAAGKLAPLAARHASLKPHAALAARLAREEGARLPDLMRNAERCAARGRFDDAVARCYRLIEWTVQWHLKRSFGIDTSKMDWTNPHLTPTVIAHAQLAEQAGKKKTLTGLMQAVKLAGALELEGAIEHFLRAPWPGRKNKTGEGRLRDMLDLRNESILAHGERPLDEAAWQRFADFMAHWNSQVLHPLLKSAGIDADPPQLPKAPPAGL
jgi:CRISPR-associated protein (TIGR02710 family)